MRFFDQPPRIAHPSPFTCVWEGEVTALVGARPKVKIPGLAGDAHEWGPCRVAEGAWTTGEVATITDGGSYLPVPHTHAIAAPGLLAVGDHVLVTFLGGQRSRPVVLGRFVA